MADFTDLELLAGWGLVLAEYADDESAKEKWWPTLRPGRLENDAIMRLGELHPTTIRQVQDFLDFVEEQYQAVLRGDSEAEEDFQSQAVYDLAGRVETAVEVIVNAESASASKLFSGKIPDNNDLVDLAVRLDAEKSKPANEQRGWNKIAREFTGETANNCPKGLSLLASLRRLRGQGRVNL